MRFRPVGVIDWSLCIQRFSSLSRWSFASRESGCEGMKLITVIPSPSSKDGFSGGQVLKCLPTVVSLLCMMSKMCPWNLVNRRFFVWPTYWVPQFLQVMT